MPPGTGVTAKLARVVHTGLVALLVAACAGPATPRPATPDPGLVTRAGLGDEWPFSVDVGELRCNELDGRPLVTFAVDGIEYALNGAARDAGFPELDATILTAWPDVSGLGPLIDRGLELCG